MYSNVIKYSNYRYIMIYHHDNSLEFSKTNLGISFGGTFLGHSSIYLQYVTIKPNRYCGIWISYDFFSQRIGLRENLNWTPLVFMFFFF